VLMVSAIYLLWHAAEACTVCDANCCSMCPPQNSACPHGCIHKADSVPPSCIPGANSSVALQADCASFDSGTCITKTGCDLWQGKCANSTTVQVNCASLSTGDCILGPAQTQCWVDYYLQTCRPGTELNCCSLDPSKCIMYSQCKHAPNLGCWAKTSSPVNVSLSFTLSAQLSNNKLLNATEQAFNKTGILPQDKCGSGKLQPINARVGSGSNGGRRLDSTAAVDVSLVYITKNQAMYNKLKAGGNTLQSGLQTAFVQALQDAGDTQTTAILSLGAITTTAQTTGATTGGTAAGTALSSAASAETVWLLTVVSLFVALTRW